MLIKFNETLKINVLIVNHKELSKYQLPKINIVQMRNGCWQNVIKKNSVIFKQKNTLVH